MENTIIIEALLVEHGKTLSAIEQLLVENNELLVRCYTAALFVIGTVGAIGVCVLLYKFLRLFF